MTASPTLIDTAEEGLTSAEAARRLEERGPLPKPETSRSFRSIAFANIFTVFNAILLAFGLLTIFFGDPKDALFMGILVANATIGIGQEVRAKLALDRLAALIAIKAEVMRDGRRIEVPVEDVVVGDLVLVGPGDQVIADGVVHSADGLQLDEANLTGESEPVRREAEGEVWSGSFVVEGEARIVATAVGPDCRAAKLAETARAFRHPRSPLEKAMDRLLIILVAVMVPLAVGLGISLGVREVTQAEAVETMTAAVVNIVPEGLILLVSLTAAVSAAKMARRGILAQQLNAIESLASVSILCTDKTGTLTEAALRVVELIPTDGVDEDELADRFGRYAASMPSRNGTLEAIHAAGLGQATAETPSAQVPFSSRRRWGALEIGGDRFALGAPEALLAGGADPALQERATTEASQGRRVLAIASLPGALPDADDDPVLPAGLEPLGLIVLAENLRPNTGETVDFFRREEVALKILSGDAPATVGAIARDTGIARGTTGPALNGEELPETDEELLAAIHDSPAIGRISPEGKERVVRVLAESGQYVGMIGDGVNDVPALKKSRLAIAQGNGTQMARSVADLVLVDGSFGQVPGMVHEGRQILRNIQRVARLFVSKAIFTAFLLMVVAIPTGIFPLLPRQFTLTSSLTIGIPAFFLALAPSSGPWRPDGFLKAIARFSIPVGIATGIGITVSWLLSRHALDVPLADSRTITAATVVTAGLAIVMVLEDEPGRRRLLVAGLCALMAAGFVLSILIPPIRDFFALERFTGKMLLAWAAGSVLGLALMAVALRFIGQGRPRGSR
ncbi:MAG: HAD-IC family P-type ATPase [Solirubrobacterales bacterium]|nr:HAD-IC family P-type ATPase [Solirubrobacterales bacterium]